MFNALLIAVALSGTALVNEADRLNFAVTECSFAQARAAGEDGDSTDAMLQRVERVCGGQRQQLEQVMLQVLQARGQSRADALAQLQDLHRQNVASLRRAYEVGRAARQG